MNLQEYLKADRQWPRYLRIAHAMYRLKTSVSLEDKTFWNQVLLANYRH